MYAKVLQANARHKSRQKQNFLAWSAAKSAARRAAQSAKQALNFQE
jgi:hypothetical protein